MFGNPCFWPCFWTLTPKPSKTGFFDPRTGNDFWTYIWTIIAKFLRVWKDRIFLKKIPNFENRTIPKLAKTKSSEKFCLSQGLTQNQFAGYCFVFLAFLKFVFHFKKTLHFCSQSCFCLWGRFHQHVSFLHAQIPNSVMWSVSFCSFGICAQKSFA